MPQAVADISEIAEVDTEQKEGGLTGKLPNSSSQNNFKLQPNPLPSDYERTTSFQYKGRTYKIKVSKGCNDEEGTLSIINGNPKKGFDMKGDLIILAYASILITLNPDLGYRFYKDKDPNYHSGHRVNGRDEGIKLLRYIAPVPVEK